MKIISSLGKRSYYSMLGKGVIGAVGLTIVLFKNNCNKIKESRQTDYEIVLSYREVARSKISSICNDTAFVRKIIDSNYVSISSIDSFRNTFCKKEIKLKVIDSLYRNNGVYAYEISVDSLNKKLMIFDSEFTLISLTTPR